MRQLYRNDSVFDSLGIFYAVISSTQGGWTWLSSEGRYMGATAYGNNDRNSNRYYAALKPIFSLQPEGRIYLNRDLANWPRDILHEPYTAELDQHSWASRSRSRTCGIRTQCCASRTSSTRRTRRSGSTRRRPRRWCSRTR